MLGILGSGFGLYGYLPAAIDLGISQVLLPIAYKDKFSSRGELKIFDKNIVWLDSEEELVNSVSILVVARRPIDQFNSILDYLSRKQLKRIVLEKPLAPLPASAFEMLDLIKFSDKKCSAGFTFRFTHWANFLKEKLFNSSNAKNEVLQLKWHFMAHHYGNNLSNWKKDHSQGGGVVRFYGIHVIALLAELGYRKVISSQVGIEDRSESFSYWKATFSGSNIPDIEVEIDSKSKRTYFFLQNKDAGNFSIKLKTPFDLPENKLLKDSVDIRCGYLKNVISEVIALNEPWPNWFFDMTQLWEIVEDCTVYRT
jgi:predicted dehydrogenase